MLPMWKSITEYYGTFLLSFMKYPSAAVVNIIWTRRIPSLKSPGVALGAAASFMMFLRAVVSLISLWCLQVACKSWASGGSTNSKCLCTKARAYWQSQFQTLQAYIYPAITLSFGIENPLFLLRFAEN